MNNIRFGKFKEIENLSIPSNINEATKIKEVKPRTKMATLIFVAFILLIKPILSLSVMDQHDLVSFLESTVTLIIFALFFLVLHEIIHAIFFRTNEEKIICVSLKKFTGIMYSIGKIKKSDWIIVSLMPIVLLGILPYILINIYFNDITNQYILIAYITVIINIVGGVFDCYVAYEVLTQVPDGALVFNVKKDIFYEKMV